MATTIKSRKKNQQKSVPTLLQAIEKVVELAEDSKMSEEFMLEEDGALCGFYLLPVAVGIRAGGEGVYRARHR